MHFFDIATSKSGPNVWCLKHIDFEARFAPQHRALCNMQLPSFSGAAAFCTFSLGNVLHATTPCTFSTSQLSKVLRTHYVFHILTSKCASRHSDVHFFDIPILPKLLKHWKNTVFRDFSTFSRTWIFSDLLSSESFSSLTLSLFPPLIFPSV